MLRLDGVTVYYGGALALENVSLSVEEGTIATIIGPNGAGKTTLLRSIIGLKRINKGSIQFSGKQIEGLSPYEIVRMGISMCPERRRILPEMTVLENLEVGAYLRKEKNEVKADLRRVFDLFPVLEERKSQLAGTLSGGEQQMLAIARALMAKPKLLMLDEPSLGLSPIMKNNIFKKINEIRREGVTILVVEQDAYSALKIADKGFVLENGKVILEGEGESLLKNDDVRKTYLGI
ncbi:MAG: ABC transporter ATP-binding protein [Candidatus Bathyarchaeia archaeon]